MKASCVVEYLRAFDAYDAGERDVLPRVIAAELERGGVVRVLEVDDRERRRIIREALAAGR